MESHWQTGLPIIGMAVIAGISAPAALAQTQTPGPMEEIQVIGTPHRASPSELAQSVTVLRDAALARAQGATLGETLAAELGVSASSFGAGASRPVIRGLAGARVRTLQDGIDSLDVSTVSDDHAVSVDPLVAEQIEIFRGPTTLLYGSGAVGGIVNTVTRRIPDYAPDSGFEGAIQLSGDTAADARSGAVRLDGGGDAMAWHIDALRRDSDDYDIPGYAEAVPDDPSEPQGRLENSATETTSYSVGGSWLGADSFLGLALSGFDSRYGVPGHAHEEGSGEAPVNIDMNQRRVDLRGGWMGLEGFIESVNLRFGVNDYEHTEFEGDEAGTVFGNQAYEARIELMHAPRGQWVGTFGVQLGDREFSAVGEEAYIPPVDTQQLGVFILEGREFGAWDVSLGGRVESVEHTPSGAAARVSDTATSVSFSGVRQLGRDYALALHTAIAQRAPVAEELFAFGPHLASQTFEVGSTDIGVETSRHVDIGLRKTMGDLTWSLTAFLTDFADFIYLRDSGTSDPDSGLAIFEYAQQDAKFTGIEAELFVPLVRAGRGELDLRLLTDYVEGELDSGESLPRLPPLRYGARLQYHNSRLIAGIEATQNARQDKIAAFETVTDAYTMMNVDLDWLIAQSNGRALRMLLRGSNLLDEDARRSTSLLKDVAPLPGRNFSVSLRASF
jgi:iron complex outermembrane receptor protein